mgnify:FL=1|jgi:anti-sigma-K factor RskA
MERIREDQDLRRTVRRLARRVERLEQALQAVITEERRWDEIELQFLAKLGACDLTEADETIDRDVPGDAFDDFLRGLAPEQWENMRRGD